MNQIPIGENCHALVDEEDFERFSVYSWYIRKSKWGMYARRVLPRTKEGPRKYVFLHHAIIGFPLNRNVVDHINGNSLDNRRSNLRIVTNRQNVINQAKRKKGHSQFKGVTFHKKHGKWWGMMGNGKGGSKYLGCFENEIDAAKAYDKAAKEKYGEYARLNFPEGVSI